MSGFNDKMKYGSRKILVTGHFGSGKTEFAVSLAFFLSEFLNDKDNGFRESKLALADVDIENPYFRSRERQEELEAAGVKVYSDPFDGKNGSELQVISPKIFGPVEDEDCRIIVDTGGDKSGAMILNQFSRHFNDDYQLLSVVNCNRPGTDTVEKAVSQIRDVEVATGLKVTGLVSNAHLITYTSVETVIEGCRFTKEVSNATGIPVLCACAMKKIADELQTHRYKIPSDLSDIEVFPIGMYMRDTYLDKKV